MTLKEIYIEMDKINKRKPSNKELEELRKALGNMEKTMSEGVWREIIEFNKLKVPEKLYEYEYYMDEKANMSFLYADIPQLGEDFQIQVYMVKNPTTGEESYLTVFCIVKEDEDPVIVDEVSVSGIDYAMRVGYMMALDYLTGDDEEFELS